MNRSKLVFFSAVSALAVAATVFAQDAASIVWRPKAGQTTKYRMTSTSNMEGQAAEFGSVVTSTVKEVRADGSVVMTTKTGDLSLKVGDQDMSGMMPKEEVVATIVYARNGELVSRALDKPSEFDVPRLENAFVFIYPEKSVKVGDTWTRKYAGDKKTNVPASTTTFTYRGVEKIDGGLSGHRIDFDFKESGEGPITGTGSAWVAAEDGDLLRTDYSLKNVVVSESAPPMDIKGTVVRISTGG